MRSFAIVVLLFIGACSKDEPAPAAKPTDMGAEDRAREREEKLKAMRERTDKVKDRKAELDRKIADAEAALAAAKDEEERKAKEAELARLRDERNREPADDGAGSASGTGRTPIDVSCAHLPLGNKDPACKK